MENLIGKSIGRYHIIEQVGAGGMAVVYQAYDTRLERNVAVKLLRTDQFIPAQLEQVLQRFEREAKSLAKLSHPNIVSILDYGEHEGMPYLVMEYLQGGTLKNKMGKPIPWEESVQLIDAVAHGLGYAHQRGIVHRDVKPANIMLDESGTPILTDFGIAKLLEVNDGDNLTASGVGMGTPEYMAPEQGIAASTVDDRADIYALGVVFYEMVTGRKPYTADTPLAVLLKHINDPLPLPHEFMPGLPQGVENILFKMLAKRPEDRYQSMDELIAALGNLTGNQPPSLSEAATILERPPKASTPVAAPPVAKPHPAPVVTKPITSEKPRQKSFGVCAVIAVVLVGLVVCGVVGGGWILSNLAAPISPTATHIPPTATSVPSRTPRPTMMSTATRRPTKTPTPDLPPPGVDTFSDNFNSNRNNWSEGEFSGDYGSITFTMDGVYRWDATARKPVNQKSWPESSPVMGDFIAGVDATHVSGEPNAAYGILFRVIDAENLYYFAVTDTGYYYVGVQENGTWTTLIDWTPYPVLANDVNKLTVVGLGDTFTFYVNNEKVNSVQDDTFTEGFYGLAIELYDSGDTGTFEFDNFNIAMP